MSAAHRCLLAVQQHCEDTDKHTRMRHPGMQSYTCAAPFSPPWDVFRYALREHTGAPTSSQPPPNFQAATAPLSNEQKELLLRPTAVTHQLATPITPSPHHPKSLPISATPLLS
jgi:hypothetical protein